MKHLLIFSISFFSGLLFSQSGPFLDGYYVTNNGDTIRGLLSRELDETLPHGIYYKANPKDDPVRLTPGGTREFYWSNAKQNYVSVLHKYMKLTPESSERKKYEQKRFMLKFYDEGRTIYQLKIDKKEQVISYGKSDSYVYYIKDGEDLYKLEKLIRYTSGENFVRIDRYKDVLKSILKDDGVSKKRIERTVFDQESLSRLFREVDASAVNRTGESSGEKLDSGDRLHLFADVGYSLAKESGQLGGYTFGGLLGYQNTRRIGKIMFVIGGHFGSINMTQTLSIDGVEITKDVSMNHVTVPAGVYWSNTDKTRKPFSFTGGVFLCLSGLRYDGFSSADLARAGTSATILDREDVITGDLSFRLEGGLQYDRFSLIARLTSPYYAPGYPEDRIRSIDFMLRARLWSSK